MPGWGSERGSAAAAASRGRGKGQGCCSADPCSAGAAARVHGTQGTAGGASSKAKAKLGSVSNGDKVTVTVACLGGVGGRNLLRALFANPVKKGVEIGGVGPRRGEMLGALSPASLARAAEEDAEVPRVGVPQLPSPSGAQAHLWVRSLCPSVHMNSKCSFTSTCSDCSAFGRLNPQTSPRLPQLSFGSQGLPSHKAPQRPSTHTLPPRHADQGWGPAGPQAFGAPLHLGARHIPQKKTLFFPFPASPCRNSCSCGLTAEFFRSGLREAPNCRHRGEGAASSTSGSGDPEGQFGPRVRDAPACSGSTAQQSSSSAAGDLPGTALAPRSTATR